MADTDDQLWIAFVSILAAFNITKAKDENGKDIEVDGEYSDTGVVASVPFSYLEISIVDPTFFSATRNLSNAQYSPGPELVGD